MKKTILMGICLAFLFIGCVTLPCPPEDIVIFSNGIYPIKIKKGFFDNKENYMTVKEWEAVLEEIKKELEEEQILNSFSNEATEPI